MAISSFGRLPTCAARIAFVTRLMAAAYTGRSGNDCCASEPVVVHSIQELKGDRKPGCRPDYSIN